MKPTGKALQVRKPTLPVARPTIALALGGGGARGLAHILMLEVFDELGLKPKVIAGTSIGAIFGAAYASGLSARLIRAHTEEVLSQRFGLIRQLLSARSEPVLKLSQLPADPLVAAQARDAARPPAALQGRARLRQPRHPAQGGRDRLLRPGAGHHRTQGDLRSAVAASIALPALFTPVSIDGRLLMDGGLVNPLPFDVLEGAADITVAIDVSGAPTGPGKRPQPSAFAALVSSSQILQRSIVREKLKSRQPDIYIDVEVDEFHVLEFHRFKEVLAAAAPGQGAAASASSPACSRARPAETLPAVATEAPSRQSPAAAQAAAARPQAVPRARSAMTDGATQRRPASRARASAWRSAAARRGGLPTS